MPPSITSQSECETGLIPSSCAATQHFMIGPVDLPHFSVHGLVPMFWKCSLTANPKQRMQSLFLFCDVVSASDMASVKVAR